MATVYAKTSCGVGRGKGGVTHLRRGEAYDDANPLVRERPDLFTAQPPDGPVVERATRAPGERRRTPRKGPAQP